MSRGATGSSHGVTKGWENTKCWVGLFVMYCTVDVTVEKPTDPP